MTNTNKYKKQEKETVNIQTIIALKIIIITK